MKRTLAFVALCFLLIATTCGRVVAAPMSLSSGDFEPGGDIPSRFTCDGQNTNPHLQISGVPAAAKSLVLILDDPDAPGGVFTHWLVWDMGPDLREVTSGGLPGQAREGVNDFGRMGYGGPCPPSGAHRYHFRIYALDIVLDLKAGSGRAALEGAMGGHILSQCELMGKYRRGQ